MKQPKDKKPKEQYLFQEGNQFWKLRTKHGRDLIIQDANKLWEDAQEYFTWCDNNPIMVTEKGFNSQFGVYSYEVPMRRPYQKQMLENSLDVAGWRTIEDLKTRSNDFLQIITRIEDIIYSQKFEGAAVGQFNSNIIARDLKLSDQTDITSGGEQIIINMIDGTKH
jgi:hypothetical protein